MPRRRILRRLLPLLAWLWLPTLAVFAALLLAGEITLVPAILGIAATAILLVLPLRPLASDLEKTVDYAERLVSGEAVDAPDVSSAAAADLVSALARLRRGVRTRDAELEGLVGMHESLFDGLPGPLFLLNRHRRITRGNLAAREIFGERLIDRDLAAVLRNPPLLDAADRAVRGEANDNVEFTMPGQTERVFRAMIAPLPHPGVEGTVAVLALHDVTELKRIEQMRADFVANASHELRTPLSALLGFIETLQGAARDDAEARERFLGIMREQASRMSRLVADLLTLSRIELNEHSRPVGRVEIASTLRRVAEVLEMHAKERKMRIVLDVPPDLPPVNGQDDEIAQIFQNLLDNALKYGRDGTPIEVTARRAAERPPGFAERGQAVVIAVRDHGEGIAREHLPRLTERFFRIDTARSRRLGGTGLGLAIVKHAINRHRGALTIDSTLGEGSTFTVYLPALEE